MKLFTDVEKYEIEVTKMGRNYSFFLTVIISKVQTKVHSGLALAVYGTDCHVSITFSHSFLISCFVLCFGLLHVSASVPH